MSLFIERQEVQNLSLVQTKLEQSLCAEDFLRRIFLRPLVEENLEENLSLTDNFGKELKEHEFVSEFLKCKYEKALIDEIRYEFNLLFVGPRRPKALPYESTYFDYKTLFGKKTMEVRGFYEAAGLKVEDTKFDKFPDDFIGYEFQYLYFMSFNALNKISNENMDEFFEIIRQKQEFLDSHPKQWFSEFAKRCTEASNLLAWKNFGGFLNLYLEKEIIKLASFRKSLNGFKK